MDVPNIECTHSMLNSILNSRYTHVPVITMIYDHHVCYVTKIFLGLKYYIKIFSVFLPEKLTLTVTSGKEVNDKWFHTYSWFIRLWSRRGRRQWGNNAINYKLMCIWSAIRQVYSRCEGNSSQGCLILLEVLKTPAQKSRKRSGILCITPSVLFKLPYIPYKVDINNSYLERLFWESYILKILITW